MQNQIYLSGARLNLLLYSFFQPLGLPVRKEGLLKAYMTACDIISQVVAENTASNILLYSPAAIYQLLVLSCFTIMKLLNSSLAENLDFEKGKSYFNNAISALRVASVMNNDVPGRSTEILARLWRGVGHSSTSQCEPSLRLRSRGSASVLHDEVWRYREEFAGQQGAYPLRKTTSRVTSPGNLHAMDTAEGELFGSYPWMWGFDT